MMNQLLEVTNNLIQDGGKEAIIHLLAKGLPFMKNKLILFSLKFF